jgi:diaminopimelate epimerase
MKIAFYKYQGTGNDFIVIDNRESGFPSQDNALVKKLCDRRFGIGADGLMLLQKKQGYAFEMVYYNSDGGESSMCGNGGRCIAAFAYELGVAGSITTFLATDGPHEAVISRGTDKMSVVKLKMGNVSEVERAQDFIYMNTGSPHYIQFVENLSGKDVYAEGREIRYSSRFREQGINVNFAEMTGDTLFVRTYERGVEAETFSCGTGVTAAALAASIRGLVKDNHCRIRTLGGDLSIYFEPSGSGFRNVWLEGPATQVFKGEIHA